MAEPTINEQSAWAASSSRWSILSRMVAQPTSRLSSTFKPCFVKKPCSCATMIGAASVRATNPMRSGRACVPVADDAVRLETMTWK